MVKYHFEFTIEGKPDEYTLQNAEDLLDFITENVEAHGCLLSGGFVIETDTKDQSNVQKPDKPV